MDRRYSSSSSSAATATETAKKASIGNALNSSIRFRNGLSSDSTVSSHHHHRKSFPSTSDVGSSFNSSQVNKKSFFLFIPCHLSFTFDISPAARISRRSITSSKLLFVNFFIVAGCFLIQIPKSRSDVPWAPHGKHQP
jgi:hypothetical protein